MDNLLNSQATVHYAFNEIIINLLAAVVLGIAIAFIYKRTHKSVSYSQSFVLSLVLVTLITSTVIMVIGNSLTRAFGLIGAFSVIRFRTAVKDARDIAFLFFALVEGMASGTGNYQIAITAYVVFTAVLVLLDKSQFGKFSAFEYILSFRAKTRKGKKASHIDLFDKYLDDHLLLNFRSTTKASEVLMTYNVRFKDNDLIKEFIAKLKKTNASNIELISSQNDIDY